MNQWESIEAAFRKALPPELKSGDLLDRRKVSHIDLDAYEYIDTRWPLPARIGITVALTIGGWLVVLAVVRGIAAWLAS